MMNPYVSILNQAEYDISAGNYRQALQVLQNHSDLYRRLVEGVVQTLLSYPGGYVADTNGNVWNTKQLAEEVRQGKWRPVTLQFLLSEIEVMKRQLSHNQ